MKGEREGSRAAVPHSKQKSGCATLTAWRTNYASHLLYMHQPPMLLPCQLLQQQELFMEKSVNSFLTTHRP